jgi:hypothetical protein
MRTVNFGHEAIAVGRETAVVSMRRIGHIAGLLTIAVILFAAIYFAAVYLASV